MGSEVHTATLRGIKACPVTVEIGLSGGIPDMTIVGMPDAMVNESKARIRVAIRSCGFEPPRAHVTVNLAPGEMRKTGTGLELPIAAAILAATHQIPSVDFPRCLFVGELALDGSVEPVRGMVSYALLAHDLGLVLVCSSRSQIATGLEQDCLQIESLSQLRQRQEALRPFSRTEGQVAGEPAWSQIGDFGDVRDQEGPKRALVIAATGNHGLLMVGPPGAGKTMLARRLPGILTPLSDRERSEVELIHSVAGLPLDDLRRGVRPFRAPHHSISKGGLIGGGRPVTPGEISLAHRGVLFLDELPEFNNDVLQALRQPVEEGQVRLARVDGTYVFPCRFLLVAAANPCPCGHLGDPTTPCTCSVAAISRYQARMGGPLADRIDLHIDVFKPDATKVIRGARETTSQQMRDQVLAGREFASWLEAHGRPVRLGAGTEVASLGFTDEALRGFEETAQLLGLGGRSITKVANVARTIANIAQKELIDGLDVAEACAYRARSQG